MNKQKIIFIIIAAVSIVLILVTFFMMKSNSQANIKKTWQELKVWIFEDDKEIFTKFLEDFSRDSWNTFTPIVESFSDWNEYNIALSSAFIRWVAPDIFVLNNNEKSIFLENASGIDPVLINPVEFRKTYKSFFWDDLIISTTSKDKKTEFLAWVPIWYETLWIYYNRKKGIEASDLETWSSLNETIIEQKEKDENVVPLWIGRWTSVAFVSDIITAFLMLDNAISLESVSDSILKSSLATYFSYASQNWDNWYNEKFDSMIESWLTNLDLFSKWEISMIIAYPRTLFDINKTWSGKNYLYSRAFPEFFMWSGKWFVNYNYFVANKNSTNNDLAMAFLKYISSETWSKKYLDKFPYYLPANISLEADYLKKEILDWYKINLSDFYNDSLEMSSFDKGIKAVYDEKIINVADDETNYVDTFRNLKTKLVCMTFKIIKLENLSESCVKKDK